MTWQKTDYFPQRQRKNGSIPELVAALNRIESGEAIFNEYDSPENAAKARRYLASYVSGRKHIKITTVIDGCKVYIKKL